MIMRFDAQAILQAAAKANPGDTGIKRAKVHAYHLWRKDPVGNLSVGQVAELRSHYMGEYPRSKLASVIDGEFPKVGFNTLPLSELTRIAADITDQPSYELAVRACGIDSKKPEHIRARAFIRGLLGMADEMPAKTARVDGEGAADRALHRFAQDDDIPDPGEDDMSDITDIEDEFPHDELSEEIEEIESPITGDTLTLELGVSDEEAEGEEEAFPFEASLDVHPEYVAGLQVFGQLEDFAGDEEEDADLPMPGDEEETTAVIEDPSAPGEMLEVTLTPVGEPGPMEEEPGMLDVPADSMHMESAKKCAKCGTMWKQGEEKCGSCGWFPKKKKSKRAALPECESCKDTAKGIVEGGDYGERTPEVAAATAWKQHGEHKKSFRIFAVAGGMLENEPMETFDARAMPHALRHLANYGVSGEVRSDDIHKHALVVLDHEDGDFLYITAEGPEAGDEFEPDINEQQPDQMAITENDGRKVLVEDGEHAQKRPSLKVPHISKDAALKICAEHGYTAEAIEAKVLEGHKVAAGTWSIELGEDEDVVITRHGQKKTASLFKMDDVIADFQVGIASEAQAAKQAAKTAEPAPPKQTSGTFELRPLFNLRCASCGTVDEFVMPDAPVAAKCAACGGVTSPEDIGRRVASMESFESYVITTDVPPGRDDADAGLNARRLMAAIRAVIPGANGRMMENERLEVQVRKASDRQLNRIRRVLEDQFGIGDIVATQTVTPQATPAQHSGVPMGAPPSAAQAPSATMTPPQAFVGPAPSPRAPTPPQTGPGMTPPRMPAPAAPAGMPPAQPAAPVQVGQAQPAATGTAVQQAAANEGRHPQQKVKPVKPARVAQLEGAEEDMGMDPDLGGEQAGDELALPDGLSRRPMTPEEEEAIMAAFTHYRDMGIGVVEGLAQFQNQYRDLLEEYGPKEAPERHLFEGEVVAIAGTIYSQPGLLMAANRRRAEESGSEFKPGINEQQPDYVPVPDDATQVLGPDSETDDEATNALDAPGIKQQHPATDQGGVKLPDSSTEPDTSNRDPGDFGAGSIVQQHPATDQKGTKLPNKELGKDLATGDNKTTKEWDATSGKANKLQQQRSKAGRYDRGGTGTRTFYLPEE
jgi:hypothetical protein